jgi:hypothetical protein
VTVERGHSLLGRTGRAAVAGQGTVGTIGKCWAATFHARERPALKALRRPRDLLLPASHLKTDDQGLAHPLTVAHGADFPVTR